MHTASMVMLTVYCWCVFQRLLLPDLKTSADRRVAVRETSVFRHHGGPIEGHMKPVGPSQHYRIEGPSETARIPQFSIVLKGLRECPQFGLHYAERRQYFGHRKCEIFLPEKYPSTSCQQRQNLTKIFSNKCQYFHLINY